MRQLTLRAIPENVERMLRQISRTNRTSINRTAIELMKKALGISDSTRKRRNVSALAGTWTAKEAEEFEKNIAVFETIDREVWEK
jgi:hypothetical protein